MLELGGVGWGAGWKVPPCLQLITKRQVEERKSEKNSSCFHHFLALLLQAKRIKLREETIPHSPSYHCPTLHKRFRAWPKWFLLSSPPAMAGGGREGNTQRCAFAWHSLTGFENRCDNGTTRIAILLLQLPSKE